MSDEIMSADRAQDWHDNGVDGTRDEVRLMTRSIVALWEIINGRTVAPTDEEIAAHDATGGTWLALDRHEPWEPSPDNLRFMRAKMGRGEMVARIWAMRDGAFCAWPAVEVSR